MTTNIQQPGGSLLAQQNTARRVRLYREAKGRCFYCGWPVVNAGFKLDRDWLFIDKGNKRMVREHMTPVTRGGTNEFANTVCSCFKCNHEKSAFTVDEFRLWKGFQRGDLNYTFASEPPPIKRRDWIVCHSKAFQKSLMVHSMPSAVTAFAAVAQKTRRRKVPTA